MDADDRPTGRVLSGRIGAMIKELICRLVIGTLRLDWELKYWTKELGCGPDALRAAVKAVGSSVDDVRARLES